MDHRGLFSCESVLRQSIGFHWQPNWSGHVLQSATSCKLRVIEQEGVGATEYVPSIHHWASLSRSLVRAILRLHSSKIPYHNEYHIISGLLDKYTLNNDREIIVFASTAKDAERIAQMLEYCSFTILLAHEFLWPEQLVEVRRQWNTPHTSDSFLILGKIHLFMHKAYKR